MKRWLLALCLVIGTAVMGPAAHAAAAVTFTGGVLTVDADGTEQYLGLVVNPDGTIHVFLDQTEAPPPVGTPDVTNTDAINLDAGGAPSGVSIDLSQHDLGPGAAVEGSGVSEIETAVSGAQTLSLGLSNKSDKVKIGTNGINLNGDDDVDVTFTLSGPAVGTLYVNAGRGNNRISALGDAVTGGPMTYDATFTAKGGRDHLIGGHGPDGDDLYGNGGDDFLDGGGGSHNDRNFGGPGFDTCRRGQRHNCQA